MDQVFPHKSITKKPAETRMGKGKGNPEYWVAVVKPGTILFEVDGLDDAAAAEAFRKCSNKLPVKAKWFIEDLFRKINMNKKDLNKMTKAKLVKKLDDIKDSLVNLKFQKKLQQLENPNTISIAKKEIAQLKTVLREMDLGIREENNVII